MDRYPLSHNDYYTFSLIYLLMMAIFICAIYILSISRYPITTILSILACFMSLYISTECLYALYTGEF